MIKQPHRYEYAEYLKGDSWKCSPSPTGAHHWIIGRQIVCKHCLVVKPSTLMLEGTTPQRVDGTV